MTKIESYEIQAFAFHVMTGYMAPGKDVSPLACEAPYEERCAAWDEWRNKHAHCILAMLHGFEALIDRDDEPTGALLDEMERLRADAERYRWLRGREDGRYMTVYAFRTDIDEVCLGDELDAAIDAAMGGGDAG